MLLAASFSDADEPSGSPDERLSHLKPLYRFAQVLTRDSDDAAQLVEATYQRAFTGSPDEPLSLDDKAALYRLLLRVHAERAPQGDGGPFRELHRRLAERYLDRMLPAAFAALPPGQQLLLFLSAAEHLPAEEAGRALHLEPAAARERLEKAHRRLREQLAAQLGGQQTLLRALPEGAIDAALRRVLTQPDPAPVPRTLRTTIAALGVPGDKEDSQAAPPASPTTPRHRSSHEASEDSSALRRYLKQAVLVLLLIFTAGLAGFLLTNVLDQEAEQERDLLTLSAQQVASAQPALRTSDPDQAQRFAQEQLSQRLTVPTIENAVLTGVGRSEVAPGMHVPVLFFEDEQAGGSITVYAYTYALLDSLSGRVELSADILRRIQTKGAVDTQTRDDRTVLIWRNRARIFVAVAQGEADVLRERVTPS